MSEPPFRILPLGKQSRADFDCGQADLNNYFRNRISQDVRRKVTSAFVAMPAGSEAIAGFYTLAACHLHLGEIGDDWRKRLPLYPTVPAALLGRLAISTAYQGRRLGTALLGDAALRALRSDVAVAMFVADAKDDAAARFYFRHGMRPSPDNPHRLFVPVATLARHLAGS